MFIVLIVFFYYNVTGYTITQHYSNKFNIKVLKDTISRKLFVIYLDGIPNSLKIIKNEEVYHQSLGLTYSKPVSDAFVKCLFI